MNIHIHKYPIKDETNPTSFFLKKVIGLELYFTHKHSYNTLVWVDAGTHCKVRDEDVCAVVRFVRRYLHGVCIVHTQIKYLCLLCGGCVGEWQCKRF